MRKIPSILFCLGGLAAGCGGSSAQMDAGAAGDLGLGRGIDSAGGSDGNTAALDGGGSDAGNVLLGPVFDPGFIPCGQATVDNAALQAACNSPWMGMPNPYPTTMRECSALTLSADVAMGCRESESGIYKLIEMQAWVRVTARSSGAWSFDSHGTLFQTDHGPAYYVQSKSPDGFVLNDYHQGGGSPWTSANGSGIPAITTLSDTTFAGMLNPPGGTYTKSGQALSATFWVPFQEIDMQGNTQIGFALGIPVSGTTP